MSDLQSKPSQIYFKVFQILNPNGITKTQKESIQYECSLLFYLFSKNTGSLCLIYYYGMIIYNSIYV